DGRFSTPLFVCPNAFAEFFKTAACDTDAYYKVYVGGSEAMKVKPELSALTQQAYVTDCYTLTDELRKHGAVNLDLTMTNTAVHDELAWRAPQQDFFKKFSLL
ncbi:MAG: hypothetical protein K2I75_08365, partial [Clostridiales bacterium]|nr:hypothetical protein [Clostridiales bacterium]